MNLSFKNYLSYRDRAVLFIFGRFNPISKGHISLFESAMEYAQKHEIPEIIVFTTNVKNDKKNPLDFETKINILKESLPEKIKISEKILKSPHDIVIHLQEQGYRYIIMGTGKDKLRSYLSLKHNLKESLHNTYFNVVEMGEMSSYNANYLRDAAKNEDYEKFTEHFPLKDKSEEVYKEIRESFS